MEEVVVAMSSLTQAKVERKVARRAAETAAVEEVLSPVAIHW